MKNKPLIYSILFLFAILLIACSGGHRRENRGSNPNLVDNNEINQSDEILKGTRNTPSNSSEPDEQKIKYDLAGRTIVEPTKELHRSKFQIRSSTNVLSVEILGKERNGNQIFYSTRLKLSDEVNTYLADVNITYTNNNQWIIQHLESKFLDIIPTRQFDNCIKVTKGGWAECYYFNNNCDVALLVEGQHIGYYYSTHWSYFAEMIPANGEKKFIGTYADYKIERIERP